MMDYLGGNSTAKQEEQLKLGLGILEANNSWCSGFGKTKYQYHIAESVPFR